MKKTLLVLVLAVVGAGCRKKPPLPSGEVTAAPPPAEAPAEQPPVVEVPTLPPPPPPPPATGHVPTSEEIRTKLQPIFPAIAICISKAGSVKTEERYLILRFGISSASGSSLNAEITGHEEARGCVDEALKLLHFEPWNGPPSIITLPLTHAGEPVPESAFGDAGVEMSALDEHDQKVAVIAAAVRDRVGRGEPVHIQKGGVHHFVPLPGDRRFGGAAIDISSLNQILHIDAQARICIAEPGVTFAELVKATLAHGLIPTVVPELEGITVGGAVAGCSVESMSYKEGGFHDSCLEYEVVTGAGELKTLTPANHSALFHMIHGSYGTLAVLTRLRFRLVPAKRFVQLEYRTLPTAAAFEAEMRARCQARDYDFIDGIIHGPGAFVLCLGRFVDSAPYVSSYRWLNIYYKSTRTKTEDYLSTEDYCFRYDTECHWLTRTVPPLEWKAVRFAVGKIFLGSTNLIRWSNRLGPILGLKKRPDVVVDVFIPGARFGEFLNWYESDFKYYPLWIVPYRIPEPYPWIAASHAARWKDELFIDCAVYGKLNSEPTIDWSQVLEEKTYALDGIKTLISRNHHSREQFWQIYHRDNYQAAKAELDPKGIFPSLYEKFHRA